jgi:ParB/RepB/Spo0J family partition protein
MAKMGAGTGLRKIPLSQIELKGNVRVHYEDIDELAESIKKLGQLEPALVKIIEPDADGERFELTAGHRRYFAIKKLCDAGEGFTTIDAVVVTGDKTTIQLVENLQRNDLTPAERESGIYEMCKSGLAQKEVAARLSKPVEFVSRNVSAWKIRLEAQASKIDTTDLATGTLNEIQAAPTADYPALVKEIIKNGGTSEAARVVMENYRVTHGKPANPKGKGKQGGLSDPMELHPSPVIDQITEELSSAGLDTDIDISLPPPETEPKEKPSAKQGKKESVVDNDFDPPHKQVDFNTICLLIMGYKKEIDKGKQCRPLDSWAGCAACENQCAEYHKIQAIEKIIALLHAAEL